MDLKKLKSFKELPLLLGILIYAYIVNWYTGNIGIIPIDSFGFLDTGFSILKGHLPIRDFWIFTGLVVDYMEAFFLLLFGNNWNSHLAHSSFMNILATAGVFFFLKELNLKLVYVVFYSLSFATLCYPVSGTPFAYIHAYIFSLLAIFSLILATKKRSILLWFIFPFICSLAFLSMQTPTTYILIILLFPTFYFLSKKNNYKNLKYFILGSISCFLIFFLFLYVSKTPITNFIYQYILFPLTIGEGRITSSGFAYIGLLDQLNLKRLFGEFKFIHFFLIPLIFISIKNFKKNKELDNSINLIIIFAALAFFFNQLITANQIYIFSLIPILAAVLQMNINKTDLNFKFSYLIIFIVLFATVKFHHRFNIERKFHDLENLDKSKALSASLIHKNFNNLRWISKFDDPDNELRVIQKAINVIEKDTRSATLITHYQFMSTFLNKPLNILNRWYLWDNNTHPTENHKHFAVYKSLINKNIKENKVEVIYLLGNENEILFDNIKNYFNDICFKNKIIIKKRFSSHEITSCKN